MLVLCHFIVRVRLSKYLYVNIVDINIYIVIFQFTILEFGHQTVGPFVLTETARNFIRVDPQG